MLEYLTFRCRPGAQFHFGKIALDENTSLNDTTVIMHSDALAGALVDVAFRVLETQVAQQVLSDFAEGNVRVSSLFWQLQTPKGRSVFFLPKPISMEATAESRTDEEPLTDRKDLLKVRFISKGVWESGLGPAAWNDESQCLILQRTFVLTRAEAEELSIETAKKMRLYHTLSLPKVSVHQLTRENALYFQTNVQIANLADYGWGEGSVHLYCLLEGEADARQSVYNLARILADEGIGGERTVGCGQLESVDPPKPFSIQPSATQQGGYCTASLVSPSHQAELDQCRFWKTITRGGRPTTHDGLLKRLKMMTEGTVTQGKIAGKTHIISSQGAQYDYRRFGTALCLPLHDHHYPNPTTAP